MSNLILITEEQLNQIEKTKQVVLEGITYKLVKELIEPGDMFWMPFMSNTIEIMKDVDYGNFNPNSFQHCLKLVKV